MGAVRVIAIDGPAGSGKSTVARRLAERLGLEYLDTGAMYRSVAFAAMAREVDLADADAVVEVARSSDIHVDDSTVVVDGVDATTQIRGPEVTRSVSTVAAISGVREVLRVRQRAWAMERGRRGIGRPRHRHGGVPRRRAQGVSERLGRGAGRAPGGRGERARLRKRWPPTWPPETQPTPAASTTL